MVKWKEENKEKESQSGENKKKMMNKIFQIKIGCHLMTDERNGLQMTSATTMGTSVEKKKRRDCHRGEGLGKNKRGKWVSRSNIVQWSDGFYKKRRK